MIDKIRYIIGQLLIAAAFRVMTPEQVLHVVETLAGIDKDLKIQRVENHIRNCSACTNHRNRMSN